MAKMIIAICIKHVIVMPSFSSDDVGASPGSETVKEEYLSINTTQALKTFDRLRIA